MVDFHVDATGGEEQFVVPVGIAFHPYYEFAHGSRIGIGFGPIGLIMLDSDVVYTSVPLGLDYGFTFLPRAPVSPYARVGFRYHFVTGDYVEETQAGVFVAAGVELFRKGPVGVGVEVAYDGTTVTVMDDDFGGDEEEITPGGVVVSVRAVL
jgi:hypothetical protein